MDISDSAIIATNWQVTLPAAPTGPGYHTAGNQTATSIEMNWVDNVTGETGWRVPWALDGQTFDHYVNVPGDNDHYILTGLENGKRYHVRVRAYGNGQDTGYTPKTGVTTVMPAPLSPNATALSSSEIRTSWTDSASNELGFNIYRSETGTEGGEWTPVGCTLADETTFLDTGLDDDKTYFYKVEAQGEDAASAWTVAVHATTLLGPPDAPSNLVANSTTPGQIDLSWTDNSDSEARFVLQRFDPDATAWTTLPTQAAGATTYQDPGLQQGETYRYRVRAENSAGASA